MVTTPLLQRGIARPYAGANQPVLSGETECCDDAVTCQDSVTIADSAAVQGIVYTTAKGEEVAITFPATATNLDAVVAAVTAALLPYEVNVFVWGVNSSTNFILYHQGQGTLESVTIGGSPTAATRLCEVHLRCDYTATLDGTTAAATGITVDGTTEEFAADIIYGTTSASTAQTLIQGELDDLALDGGATVTVVDNTEESVFEITISAWQGHEISIGDTTFSESNCQQVFEEA